MRHDDPHDSSPPTEPAGPAVAGLAGSRSWRWGLGALVLATSLALGALGPWWLVPAYLALMGWLVYAPTGDGPDRRPERAPGDGIEAAPPGPGPASEPDLPDRPAASDGGGATPAPTGGDGPGAATGAAGTATTTKRSRKGRSRSKAAREKAAPEPAPAAWVRVGPGKFVRVEGSEALPNDPTETTRAALDMHPIPPIVPPDSPPDEPPGGTELPGGLASSGPAGRDSDLPQPRTESEGSGFASGLQPPEDRQPAQIARSEWPEGEPPVVEPLCPAVEPVDPGTDDRAAGSAEYGARFSAVCGDEETAAAGTFPLFDVIDASALDPWTDPDAPARPAKDPPADPEIAPEWSDAGSIEAETGGDVVPELAPEWDRTGTDEDSTESAGPGWADAGRDLDAGASPDAATTAGDEAPSQAEDEGARPGEGPEPEPPEAAGEGGEETLASAPESPPAIVAEAAPPAVTGPEDRLHESPIEDALPVTISTGGVGQPECEHPSEDPPAAAGPGQDEPTARPAGPEAPPADSDAGAGRVAGAEEDRGIDDAPPPSRPPGAAPDLVAGAEEDRDAGVARDATPPPSRPPGERPPTEAGDPLCPRMRPGLAPAPMPGRAGRVPGRIARGRPVVRRSPPRDRFRVRSRRRRGRGGRPTRSVDPRAPPARRR